MSSSWLPASRMPRRLRLRNDRKALWSRPQARNLLHLGAASGMHRQRFQPVEKGIFFSQCCKKKRHLRLPNLQAFHSVWVRRIPKGDRKALWSRPQARNLLHLQENIQNLQNKEAKTFTNSLIRWRNLPPADRFHYAGLLTRRARFDRLFRLPGPSIQKYPLPTACSHGRCPPWGWIRSRGSGR